MNILEVKDLTLGYEGKTVVDGLSFSVEKGDYLVILGENGTGKSTLMKALVGLIRPQSGRISFSSGLKKREIGYLPQQTQHQKDFPATVKEIVLSGFQGKTGLRPFYNKKEKERAKEVMEMLDLLQLEKRCFRELSGGQQQRVLLARALCATEELLFLDEPVAGLDPKVMTEMYFIIEMLNKKGVTVVMISHDVECAKRYAKHILHLGKHRFFGTKEEYLASETGMRYIAQTEVKY